MSNDITLGVFVIPSSKERHRIQARSIKLLVNMPETGTHWEKRGRGKAGVPVVSEFVQLIHTTVERHTDEASASQAAAKARGGEPLRACFDFNFLSLSRARKF